MGSRPPPKTRMQLTRLRVLLLLVLAVSSSSLLVWRFTSAIPAPSINTIVEPGSGFKSCDYIVYQDGTNTLANNCRTGANDYLTSATDISAFLQTIDDQLKTNGGGLIYFAQATFQLGHVVFNNHDGITWQGSGWKTILQFPASGAVGPMLDFQTSVSNRMVFRNLRFDGNGRSASILSNFGNMEDAEIAFDYFQGQGAATGISLCRGDRIDFHDNIYIADNAAKNADAIAFCPDFSDFHDNIVVQNAGTGDLVTASQIQHTKFRGNTLWTTTSSINAGIFLETNLGNTNDIIVEGNTCNKCDIVLRGQTLQTTTSNRVVIANNILNNGGRIDLELLNAVSGDLGKINNTIVSGNILDTGSILVRGEKNLQITNNRLGSGTISISAPNTNVFISYNYGYRTENQGSQVSVADGGTISHGLVSTPTLAECTASIASQFCSVTALSASTFTVAIKTDTGAAGTTQTVYWRAVFCPVTCP